MMLTVCIPSGTILVDDDDNFGQKKEEEVKSSRYESLIKDRVYYVYISQE